MRWSVVMDVRQKALVVFTVVAMLVGFAYVDLLLAVFAGIATIPFLAGVLGR